MNNKINNNLNPNYDQHTHINLLNDAINRMGNNHFKFMVAFFSILAFSITSNKFAWDMSFKPSIVFFAVNIIFSTMLSIACIYMSYKYLKLERKFRALQKRVFDLEFNTYEMNISKIGDSTSQKGKKYGFTFWFMILMLCFSIISSLIFLVIKVI